MNTILITNIIMAICFMFFIIGAMYLIYRNNSGVDELAKGERLLKYQRIKYKFDMEQKQLNGKTEL